MDQSLKSLSKCLQVLMCLPLELQAQGDQFNNSKEFLLDDEPNFSIKIGLQFEVEQIYLLHFLDLLAQFQVEDLPLLQLRQV